MIVATLAGMAQSRKRGRRSTAPKVSKKMAGVRPLRGTPGIARRYDPGFKEPPEKSPWQDEGRPETGG
jgi:hypothetical protein